MSGAVVPGSTVLRIGRCYANHMLVDMAIVRMMQMPVVQVVDMVIVHNAGVAALRTMRMIMIVVLRRVALAHCQVLIKCYLVNIQTPANSCAIDYDKIDRFGFAFPALPLWKTSYKCSRRSLMSASGAARNAWPCLAFSHFAFSGYWSLNKFDRFSRIQFPHGSTDKYGKGKAPRPQRPDAVRVAPVFYGENYRRTLDRFLGVETTEEIKMKTYKRYAHLTGNLVMVGFGSIGQAVLPLLFRHLDLHPRQVRIVSAGESGGEVAQEFGVSFTPQALTKENYLDVLSLT